MSIEFSTIGFLGFDGLLSGRIVARRRIGQLRYHENTRIPGRPTTRSGDHMRLLLLTFLVLATWVFSGALPRHSKCAGRSIDPGHGWAWQAVDRLRDHALRIDADTRPPRPDRDIAPALIAANGSINTAASAARSMPRGCLFRSTASRCFWKPVASNCRSRITSVTHSASRLACPRGAGFRSVTRITPVGKA